MVLAYYLTIDGIEPDFLRIRGYQLDISNPRNSPGGGSGGNATFSPLVVNLDLNSDLTPLLIKAASGEIIRSIRIDGYTQEGNRVHSLKLGDVSITRYYDTDIEFGDSLSFSYSQIELTNIPQSPDGTLGAPITVSWNILTNEEGGTIPEPQSTTNPLTQSVSGVEDDLVFGIGNEGMTTGEFKADSLTNSRDSGASEVNSFDTLLLHKPDWVSDLKNIGAISFLKGDEIHILSNAEVNNLPMGSMSSDVLFSPTVQSPFTDLVSSVSGI